MHAVFEEAANVENQRTTITTWMSRLAAMTTAFFICFGQGRLRETSDRFAGH